MADAEAHLDDRVVNAVCGNWSEGNLAKKQRWTLPDSR
jgi:hypothetical protein